MYDDIGNQCIIDACEQDKNELFRRENLLELQRELDIRANLVGPPRWKTPFVSASVLFFEEELWID